MLVGRKAYSREADAVDAKHASVDDEVLFAPTYCNIEDVEKDIGDHSSKGKKQRYVDDNKII